MTKIEPGEGAWISSQHERAKRPWNTYIQHMAEVEEVWQASFEVISDLDTPQLEFKQPTEGRAIIKKMNEMLSLNADKRTSVARFSNNEIEKRKCDQLERFLAAYQNDLAERLGYDIFALSGTMLLIRGKKGMHTTYKQDAEHPKIRVKYMDPCQYFPVYGDNGISWFTYEEWMYRWQLIEFFENLGEKELDMLEMVPNLKVEFDDKGREYEADLDEMVQLIQYWNWDWSAWSIGNQLIAKHHHKWGRMTLREAKLEATLFEDPRWQQEPFIGPIVDALKMKAAATSKAANAAEAYYYPRVLTKSAEGEIIIMDSTPTAGDTTQIGADGEVIVLNPHANQEQLKVLIDLLNNDIQKMTLPDPAWTSSVGDESGFRASLTLNQIKGGVADVRRSAETCDGLVLGDVLWMHERYAPKGGWEIAMLEPDGKNRIQSITKDDIGKHQKVTVKITPALPQDMLQMITNRNLLIARDPVTGMVNTDIETANDLTGLSEIIGDTTQAQERRERDFLLTQDEETRALYAENLKVQNANWIREMKRNVERYERIEQKRELKKASREIEQGLTEDIVLPSEIANDPQQLQQFVQLVSQGMTPQAALDALEDGMPLGMPGEMVTEGGTAPGREGNFSPETQNVLGMLFGQQQPNGLTGYEGVNPMAGPAAMMGAQPRRVVDQPQVEVENIDELQQRGALPPPS